MPKNPKKRKRVYRVEFYVDSDLPKINHFIAQFVGCISTSVSTVKNLKIRRVKA